MENIPISLLAFDIKLNSKCYQRNQYNTCLEALEQFKK